MSKTCLPADRHQTIIRLPADVWDYYEAVAKAANFTSANAYLAVELTARARAAQPQEETTP